MKRITIITVFVIAATLTSCGKSDESTATESKPEVTTVAETVTTTAAPQTTS